MYLQYNINKPIRMGPSTHPSLNTRANNTCFSSVKPPKNISVKVVSLWHFTHTMYKLLI